MSPAKRNSAAGQAQNSKGLNKDGDARPVSYLPREQWVVVVAWPVRQWLLLLWKALADVVEFKREITVSLYVCRGRVILTSPHLPVPLSHQGTPGL